MEKVDDFTFILENTFLQADKKSRKGIDQSPKLRRPSRGQELYCHHSLIKIQSNSLQLRLRNLITSTYYTFQAKQQKIRTLR